MAVNFDFGLMENDGDKCHDTFCQFCGEIENDSDCDLCDNCQRIFCNNCVNFKTKKMCNLYGPLEHIFCSVNCSELLNMCRDSKCLHLISHRIKIEESLTQLHRRRSAALCRLFWTKLNHRGKQRHLQLLVTDA